MAFSGTSLIRPRAARRFCVVAVLLLSATALAAGSQDVWPDFRGPWHNGFVKAPGDTAPRDLPLQWSETENVKWKTEIPLKGWSSPVVMDGKIWITTATEDGREFYVICADAETGAILLNNKLFTCDNPEPLGNNVNSYASPSPVIEAGRVYVHFGSYGTACLDTADGKVLWQRQDLPCRHYRGPGSSPFLFQDLLILTFDGADLQYLVALDKNTGKDVWKTDRTTEWHDFDEQGIVKREGDFRKAFSTPIVCELGGKPVLLTAASCASYAYEPGTGKEIWKTRNIGYTPASRPVFGNGLVYFTTGQNENELFALRVEGTGDVTDSNVAWRLKDGTVPTDSSPILVDDLLYMVSNDGALSCMEAATGTKLWTQRIGGNYEASPIYVDGNLYFFSVQGKTSIVKHGRAFELVAANKLDTGCMASPAVLGKSLIVRTKTHLYRIEAAAPAQQ